MTRTTARAPRDGPRTLAVDVGGTGVKAAILDASGAMICDRVRVPTPYPFSPTVFLATLRTLVRQLPAFERVSIGFPGMVRKGRILWAPEFATIGGLGTAPDPRLATAWQDYDLAAAVRRSLRRPTRVANDADLQGAAVVKGRGVELVITLGTGFGTALFEDGRMAPHMEFAHHPFRKGQTYAEQIGDAARKRLSTKKWNERVVLAVHTLDQLIFFDHLYVGGGNATRVTADLGPKASIVDNAAGIAGGIKLWDQPPT